MPELLTFDDWPLPEDWQTIANHHGIWELIGINLAFTLEEKLGQRARRKQPKGPGRSYEASILRRQEIPTRASNLHDFFNALIWLNFPNGKYTLHRKAYEVQGQWSEIHDRQQRCPLADRLTCFDEGGIVFEIPSGLGRREIESLILSRNDNEKQAFVEEYARGFTLFGHGMMEVMMKGNISIFASCILLDTGSRTRDQKLTHYLDSFGPESPDHGSINMSWLLPDERGERVKTQKSSRI